MYQCTLRRTVHMQQTVLKHFNVEEVDSQRMIEAQGIRAASRE
jgi:hypothetical protein